MTPKHPMQPLVRDADGVVRFKQNAIVRFLLDAGPFDLNQIALMPFSDEDREHFAQLIGYSLDGFGELSYVSDESYEQAAAQSDEPDATPYTSSISADYEAARKKSLK
jgi:hypothetical protein